MELNGVQFSIEQLAELYTGTLVVSATSTPPTVSKSTSVAAPAIPVKGKNKKGVLWLVQEPDHAYLNDADFEFLSQIVSACKMNMEDIALVNLAQIQKTINEVADALQPSVVILCGVEYQQLPFKLEEYIIYPHARRNYFLADRLEELRNDKAKKTKLWLALKAMFSL
jgi:hypothetical protein